MHVGLMRVAPENGGILGKPAAIRYCDKSIYISRLFYDSAHIIHMLDPRQQVPYRHKHPLLSRRIRFWSSWIVSRPKE